MPEDDSGAGCEARYVEVVAGAYHTCAHRTDNAVDCFSNGLSGRLGNGLSSRASPGERSELRP